MGCGSGREDRQRVQEVRSPALTSPASSTASCHPNRHPGTVRRAGFGFHTGLQGPSPLVENKKVVDRPGIGVPGRQKLPRSLLRRRGDQRSGQRSQRRRLVPTGRVSIGNEAGVLDSAPRLISVLDTSILYGFSIQISKKILTIFQWQGRAR